MSSISVLPMSIGTGIAIQAIIGYDAEGLPLKTGPSIQHFDSLYVSIRTLIRNFVNNHSSEDKLKLTPDDVLYGVLADLKVLRETVVAYGGPHFSVMPYLCLYNDLQSIFKHAALRTANTENQKHYLKLEDAVIKKLKESVMQDENTPVLVFHTKLDKNFSRNNAMTQRPTNSLILTHIPVDLLSSRFFNKLVLLESHTGKLKSSTEWNTKLKNFKPEHARLPFNSVTLQFFGDTGDMFMPMANAKIKAALVSLSEKFKWNPTTTVDRMINGAKMNHEPILASEMMKFNAKI